LATVEEVPRPVIYVRHAMGVPEDGVHPTSWKLDAEGRRSAQRLAERLEVAQAGDGGTGTHIGALVTSTEPKAVATAEEIGAAWSAEVVPDPRLREAVRPWIGPGYRAVVHRYLRGELPPGWEPHADVARRMAEALADAAVATDDPVVIVSHGLALAVHLDDRLGGGFDPEHFWSSLAFPDAWLLDETGLLHRCDRARA
jgi:broad specificity phosphatase PhoE